MTPSKKILAVVGATGAQGGGLARAILADQDGPFTARALTRDPNKPSATALQQAGAEMVAFDIDVPDSYDAAFRGAYGAFIVTSFWEHQSTAKEIQQAKALAAGCEKAGVEHIIWSTIEDSRLFFDAQTDDIPPKVHGTDMYVPNIDGKGEANSFFPAAKTTFLHTSFYLENLWKHGMCKDGTVTLPMGDAPLPVVGQEDIGRAAYGVFKAGDTFKGASVYVAGDVLPLGDIMASISKAVGKPFKYVAIPRDTYAASGIPGAVIRANLFDLFKRSTEFRKNRDPNSPTGGKALYPGIQSVAQWAEANKESLLKIA